MIFLVLLTKLNKNAKIIYKMNYKECIMKRILTLNTRNLHKSKKDGGCGECQTSCQSACKTSCGVANQECVSQKNK